MENIYKNNRERNFSWGIWSCWSETGPLQELSLSVRLKAPLALWTHAALALFPLLKMSLSRHEGRRCQKCNVLPLLSVWGVSIESTFIILTFRLPQREASFLGLLWRLLRLLRSEETGVFSPSFLKFCSRGLTRKQAPGEYWMKIKIN